MSGPESETNQDVTAADGAPSHEPTLEERAADLVNPASGLANDYLNIFNEVFLLIENLPILLPEMLDELLEWEPKTYRQYFETSPLPGASAAIEIYDSLDPSFRNDFEQIIDGVTALSLATVKLIELNRDPVTREIDPLAVSDFCMNAAITMRTALTKAADLVNHGRGESTEAAQETVERLLADDAPVDTQTDKPANGDVYDPTDIASAEVSSGEEFDPQALADALMNADPAPLDEPIAIHDPIVTDDAGDVADPQAYADQLFAGEEAAADEVAEPEVVELTGQELADQLMAGPAEPVHVADEEPIADDATQDFEPDAAEDNAQVQTAATLDINLAFEAVALEANAPGEEITAHHEALANQSQADQEVEPEATQDNAAPADAEPVAAEAAPEAEVEVEAEAPVEDTPADETEPVAAEAAVVVDEPAVEAPTVVAETPAAPEPSPPPPPAPAQRANAAQPQAAEADTADDVDDENYFTVIAGGETVGLRVLSAQTIFQIPEVTPVPLAPSCVLGLVNLRGRILTAYSLRQRLGMPDIPLSDSLAISIDHKGETFALVVDAVGDILQLNSSMRVPVPSHFDKSRSAYMSVVYKVNGSLIPAIDSDALFETVGAAA